MRFRVAATLAMVVTGGTSFAAETRTWSAGPAELLRGDADGIAVSSRGQLFLAPRVQRLDDALAAAATLEAWSACPGDPGEVFFGTGPDGVVYRTDGNGRGREFFRTGEAMVTALLRLSDGTLLAGTSPGGRVYRIDGERRGGLWVETGERYVWSLAESDGGNVYAGTGERGKVLRLRSDGSTETHFDSDEPHIVALLHDGGGTLVAGGAGIGRLYEIDIDGNGLVLYDDDLDEARSIVRTDEDGWTVALVGTPQRTVERPELRLRLPDGVSVEPNVPLEERRGPTLRGVIEGLESEAATSAGPRGRLIRIDRSGRPVVLWESASETPLSLVTDAAGRVVMGTGEPARLYRVEPDDDIALLATLREAHLTALTRADRTVFAGT
ncbi:MAG: hypothetical protein GTN89_08970, partial [Acidobacteria bacterium]|nr:hypothetical protein [Acidobacteriota bacterium]NIM60097.1 hypothetical protein [Acidobacteriota bacterium]NIO59455.1 hypothetical protein [Acidobacteriota bacterium]NIQ30486.1 hypothetical protein [Acidobacteriota bacterium]NIQ85425.1 hypothetical protein [Acidobacteriota bacterium]